MARDVARQDDAPQNMLQLAESQFGVQKIAELVRMCAEENTTISKLMLFQDTDQCRIEDGDPLVVQIFKKLAHIASDCIEDREQVLALKEMRSLLIDSRRNYATACKMIIEGAKAVVSLADVINEQSRIDAGATDEELILQLHDEGLDEADIAKLFQRSPAEVRKIVSKNKKKHQGLASEAKEAEYSDAES